MRPSHDVMAAGESVPLTESIGKFYGGKFQAGAQWSSLRAEEDLVKGLKLGDWGDRQAFFSQI